MLECAGYGRVERGRLPMPPQLAEVSKVAIFFLFSLFSFFSMEKWQDQAVFA